MVLIRIQENIIYITKVALSAQVPKPITDQSEALGQNTRTINYISRASTQTRTKTKRIKKNWPASFLTKYVSP